MVGSTLRTVLKPFFPWHWLSPPTSLATLPWACTPLESATQTVAPRAFRATPWWATPSMATERGRLNLTTATTPSPTMPTEESAQRHVAHRAPTTALGSTARGRQSPTTATAPTWDLHPFPEARSTVDHSTEPGLQLTTTASTSVARGRPTPLTATALSSAPPP